MIQPWRRFAGTAQAVVVMGLPFLKIGGESALRFDIPSLRLHFFGSSVWMEEFFIVLVAVMVLTFLVLFITLMFGRIWCGWLCPQTVLNDFTRFVDRGSGFLSKAGAYSSVLLISILVAANLIWYFISPYEFVPDLMTGRLGNITGSFWIALTGIVFLNLVFLRYKFCATVCPYAKLQGVLFDNKTLVISFDPRRRQECLKCNACIRSCPTGIDIRKGLNASCTGCAECIDACAEMMGRRQEKSLIGYFFGGPGEAGGRMLRQNAVITGSVTAAFSIFFIYLVMTCISVDMMILPNYSFPPHITADGGVTNSYVLSVKNRGKSDAELFIEAKALNGIAEVVPGRVAIGPGEIRKIPVYVAVKNSGNSSMIKDIEISIDSKKTDKLRITKRVHFMYPEE